MFLTFNGELRNESHQEVIANLLRKGWMETTPPAHNPQTQYEPQWVGGNWSISDIYPTNESVAARLSYIRWQKESAGITVGDQPVSTLREEMAIWQGMLLDITLRPGATTIFEYKPRGGSNVTLTDTQVQRIYSCFAWYVAACFGTERYLVSQIGTLTNEQIIALAETDSTWPQRTFTWEIPQ
jgi:hypothetical protein